MDPLDTTNDTVNTTPEAKPGKTFSEAEVEQLMKSRRERDAENLRLQHEENKRQQGENKRLKTQLEEYERKMEKGTASTEEMDKLTKAKQAAATGQGQGYSDDDVKNMVAWELKKTELGSKLTEASKKDPEFARLVKEGNPLHEQEIMNTAYLPNGAAVVKHLLKDKKSLDVYRAALANFPHDNGVNAMMVLNNISDRLADTKESPHPSPYRPAEPLSDSSDDDQNFDVSDYINSKY